MNAVSTNGKVPPFAEMNAAEYVLSELRSNVWSKPPEVAAGKGGIENGHSDDSRNTGRGATVNVSARRDASD